MLWRWWKQNIKWCWWSELSHHAKSEVFLWAETAKAEQHIDVRTAEIAKLVGSTKKRK